MCFQLLEEPVRHAGEGTTRAKLSGYRMTGYRQRVLSMAIAGIEPATFRFSYQRRHVRPVRGATPRGRGRVRELQPEVQRTRGRRWRRGPAASRPEADTRTAFESAGAAAMRRQLTAIARHDAI